MAPLHLSMCGDNPKTRCHSLRVHGLYRVMLATDPGAGLAFAGTGLTLLETRRGFRRAAGPYQHVVRIDDLEGGGGGERVAGSIDHDRAPDGLRAGEGVVGSEGLGGLPPEP